MSDKKRKEELRRKYQMMLCGGEEEPLNKRSKSGSSNTGDSNNRSGSSSNTGDSNNCSGSNNKGGGGSSNDNDGNNNNNIITVNSNAGDDEDLRNDIANIKSDIAEIKKLDLSILKKLDSLSNAQDLILSQQTKMSWYLGKFKEKEVDDNAFLKDVIKNVVKLVFSTEIYVAKDELRAATEVYLKNNHEDFFEQFEADYSWYSYFDNHILQDMLKKFRSERGTLASKVRDAIYFIFGENTLPRINNSDSPSDISAWKKKPIVAECYKKLFCDGNACLVKIFEKVFGSKEYSLPHAAYVVAICSAFLNPRNERIKCDEDSMKAKVEYYLEKLKNKQRIEPEDDECET